MAWRLSHMDVKSTLNTLLLNPSLPWTLERRGCGWAPIAQDREDHARALPVHSVRTWLAQRHAPDQQQLVQAYLLGGNVGNVQWKVLENVLSFTADLTARAAGRATC